MSITAVRKTELIHTHARSDHDTGSAEVQVDGHRYTLDADRIIRVGPAIDPVGD